MNEELAQYYGTLENVGMEKAAHDFQLEKVAEAQVLDEMLQAEGYNIEQIPTEEIIKMAYNLYGEDSALVKQAEAMVEQPEEEEETFQEKLAEADYLGRLMAHAYVNELSEIEKQASMGQSAKMVALKGLSKARKAGEAVGKGVERLGKGVTETVTRAGKGSAARMNPLTAKAIGAGTVGVPLAAGAYGVKKMLD